MTTERQALTPLLLTEEQSSLIQPFILLQVRLQITLMSRFQHAFILKNHQKKKY